MLEDLASPNILQFSAVPYGASIAVFTHRLGKREFRSVLLVGRACSLIDPHAAFDVSPFLIKLV